MYTEEDQIISNIINLVNKEGLEKTKEIIKDIPDDTLRWYMKILYKSIYKC